MEAISTGQEDFMLGTYETLRVQTDDHVAEAALDRPDRGNAMNLKMFDELGRLFREVERDPEIRVLLLRAEGKAFTYGLDLMEAAGEAATLFQGGLAGPRTQFWNRVRELQSAVGAAASSRKPVIAAVHGWCIGGGLDLIAACDIRFASADAKFSLREGRIGIVADLGSLQRLPRLIGDAHTRELALTAKDIDAQYALRIGLVSQVLPDADALWKSAREEARRIAGLPPLVVQGIKQVLNFQDGKSVADGLEYVAVWNSAFLHSEDFAEAVAAFLEKRPPKYKGA
jgi:enoyl-CoA hydratase